MRYNPLIHNRKSTRLKGYDYSQMGLYFITICTKNRECLFASIHEGKVILTDGGDAANDCWLQIPTHFPNTVLHEHIVMPNHIHGIIELKDAGGAGAPAIVRAKNFSPLRANGLVLSPMIQKPIPFKSPSKTIGSIVRGYKIGVTKWFRKEMPDYFPWGSIWHRNYHDHIIRNQESYEKIANYIINNPFNWKEDKFFIE